MNKDGSRTRKADGEVEYTPPHIDSQDSKRPFKHAPSIDDSKNSTMWNTSNDRRNMKKTSRNDQIQIREDETSYVPSKYEKPAHAARNSNRTQKKFNVPQDHEDSDHTEYIAADRVKNRKGTRATDSEEEIEQSYSQLRQEKEIHEPTRIVPNNIRKDHVNKANDKIEATYSKKPREISYKPHTIDEYKMINVPVRLGGLGPDLQNEELRVKQEKRQKMMEYSREIAMSNYSKLRTVQSKSPQSESDRYISSADSEGNTRQKRRPSERKKKSAREKALDFASKIPKPPVRLKESEGVKTSSLRSKNTDTDDILSLDNEPQPLSDLELLELKHKKEKEWLEKEFGDLDHYSI